MFVRSLARASILLCASVGALLAVMAPVAHARAPVFTGQPILAEFDDGQVFLNLKTQNVIVGGPPVNVTVGNVLIDGQVSGLVNVFAISPLQTPNSVCLSVQDVDFTNTVGTTVAVTLTATNGLGQSTTQLVPIQLAPGPTLDFENFAQLTLCGDPNTSPVADAGTDQTVNDTDGQGGENITLNASASTDPDAGTELTYSWFDGQTRTPLAGPTTNPQVVVNLGAGTHTITLEVRDDSGDVEIGFDEDDVQVTVNAPALPTANAGPDQTLSDTDGEPGENVTLTGTASDPDGTIAAFEWFRLIDADTIEPLGAGATITARLPDGTNDVRLRVTDNAGNAFVDSLVVTIAAAPPETTLSELPNLTPNERRMATKLDSMCDSLAQLARDETSLSADQQDLLAKCQGIRLNNSTANQIEAIEELIPEDFAVARTQTLLFANTQYVSIMDRLIALRGGARGLSLAGLNVIVDGKMVPLAAIEDMVKQFFGGGASADEPGGLLSDKWGLWARGNFSFGEKDATPASPAFDADQWSFVGGLDYRLSDKAVIGTALSYGSSSVDFSADDGALDTDSFSLSLYGSAYAAKNFYFDGIVNFTNSSYDAFRNIAYVDGTGLVSADARGDTDGTTLSGGLSAGYDFLAGGLTISPNIGVFYIDTTIDEFTEAGAGGLNLIYDEQKFKSMTGNVGLRLTYAWNLSWGVLLPQLRADYVKEFEDDVDVFGVRFANDPNAVTAPPVLVATDNPDQSYWRLAGGFSAQFKHGISGYIEYQRLESFEFITFQDIAIGLRFQRSF